MSIDSPNIQVTTFQSSWLWIRTGLVTALVQPLYELDVFGLFDGQFLFESGNLVISLCNSLCHDLDFFFPPFSMFLSRLSVDLSTIYETLSHRILIIRICDVTYAPTLRPVE